MCVSLVCLCLSRVSRNEQQRKSPGYDQSYQNSEGSQRKRLMKQIISQFKMGQRVLWNKKGNDQNDCVLHVRINTKMADGLIFLNREEKKH